MIWAVTAVVVGVIIAVGVAVATGRVRPAALPEPVSTTPRTAFPAAGTWTGADVRALRFETALRGYDPVAVDDYLDRRAGLLEEATSVGVSPEPLQSSPDPGPLDPSGPQESLGPREPSGPRWRMVVRGYRMDQVDAVLSALAEPAPPPREDDLAEGDLGEGDVGEDDPVDDDIGVVNAPGAIAPSARSDGGTLIESEEPVEPVRDGV